MCVRRFTTSVLVAAFQGDAYYGDDAPPCLRLHLPLSGEASGTIADGRTARFKGASPEDGATSTQSLDDKR